MANAQTVAVAADDVARRTLRTLIDRLHPAVLDVLVAPVRLDREVGDPVILDPVNESLPPADAVVLAVGVDTPRAQAALLDRLVDADVAAVVLRYAGPLSDAVAQGAHAAEVAVLSAPPALSWGQLYSFLLTVTSAPPVDAADQPEAPLGDVFALANAVAAMVGGATTIEDPASRVLAYSNLDFPIDQPRQQTILGRAVPGESIRRLQNAGVYRRLWQSDGVVRVPDLAGEPDCLSRLAVAVRAGGELLGTIWVIEGTQPLGPEAERTLREAADIAALHLLRHRTAGDVERHRRAEALLRLLDGVDRAEQARTILGLDPDQPVTVVAFDVGSGSDAATVMAARRVADLVAYYCESYRRQAACAATGSRVYALLPTQLEAASDPAAALARAIVDRAGSGAPPAIARRRRLDRHRPRRSWAARGGKRTRCSMCLARTPGRQWRRSRRCARASSSTGCANSSPSTLSSPRARSRCWQSRTPPKGPPGSRRCGPISTPSATRRRQPLASRFTPIHSGTACAGSPSCSTWTWATRTSASWLSSRCDSSRPSTKAVDRYSATPGYESASAHH